MALFAVLRPSPVAAAAAAAAPSFSCVSGRALDFWLVTAASAVRVTSSSKRRVSSRAARSLSIRCEQSANQGGGPDVWLGRAAMVGFASAIAVEVATGKGVLQNFGVATPAPTLALVVSGLVVGLAVFFILQSGGSRD
ncbi:stress enhanced protein 1, chloroplastic isoform X1 [Setaria viridis]|uniref:stress enhanced protein 1, chloroplastic isoform X1 n=1 Tax=Setaria viridis TaxID=4556 RepID=UPI00149397B6|nr:stress enhanced protein 1, chloroplastic-like isoform X1 [Setaria viridis]